MKNDLMQIVRSGLEQRLGALKAARAFAQRPARGWLRAVREATGIGQEAIARKLGVKRQSYVQLEEAEARGAITLASLQRAAEAMECELVYFVIPRESVARSYSELAKVHDPDFKHLQASEHSMALEGQAVGDLTKQTTALS
jgi:predicted DNA-binding mobile mystery protein A